MTLQVIGAGFGRTGTESMKKALELLGYGPCYHMFEVTDRPDRQEQWKRAARGDTPDWDIVFSGFKATVDWPASYFWRGLSAHYPDAKILLTVRSAESWYASMENTILKFLRSGENPEGVGATLVGGQVFGGKFARADKDHIIGRYLDNIAQVQAHFGKDRLLTYELGSGWEPLCTFLGCDVPAEDYPNSNNSAAFQARFHKK